MPILSKKFTNQNLNGNEGGNRYKSFSKISSSQNLNANINNKWNSSFLNKRGGKNEKCEINKKKLNFGESKSEVVKI